MSRQIGEDILVRLVEERREFIPSPAVARIDASLNGIAKVLWLTNEPAGGHIHYVTDINGGISDVRRNPPRVLTVPPGNANVYKNTRLGEVLILNSSGHHAFGADAGHRSLTIKSKAAYFPDISNVDALEVQLSIGSNSVLRIPSLRQWTTQLQESEASQSPRIDTSVDADEIELQRLIEKEEQQKLAEEKELMRLIDEEESLNKLIADQEESSNEFLQELQELDQRKHEKAALHARVIELKSRRRQFIRTQSDLRTQHILDPLQEKVKRGHFFDGRFLVIEGGPGTGKTTTLIQRIKFLISESIEEYLEMKGKFLADEEKHVLFGTRSPWVFISPSQLLKEYLKNAMGDEGLGHLESAVVDWHSYKRDLCRKYRIYAKGAYIEPCSNQDEGYQELFFYSDPGHIRSLEAHFTKALYSKLSRRISELRQLSFGHVELNVALGNILNNTLQSKIESLRDLIQVYNNLNVRHGSVLTSLRDSGNELLRISVRRKLDALASDLELRSNLEAVFAETEGRSQKSWLERLQESLDEIVRKKAAEGLGSNEHFSERDLRIVGLYGQLLDFSSTDEMELIGFAYLFGSIGTGINQNVFDEVLPSYREFRKSQEFRISVRVLSHSFLDQLLEKNRKVHPDEEAFLLGFINRIMLDYRSAAPQAFREIQQSRKHSFQVGFEGAIKAVIAVDEITDFGLMDIDCITSFAHPVISSVTFCGDLMQRMTLGGIKDWDKLDSTLSRRISSTGSYCDIVSLERSYRQSPSVLEIARTLFKEQQSRPAPFKSTTQISPFEPKPKLFISENQSKRMAWMGDYIRSISEDYSDGVLPTIAVIVKDDQSVFEVKRLLEIEPAIQECGIPVEACDQGRVIGNANSVRVFSVKFIKGLEFESVIFHDIEHLHSTTRADMIGKFLYVGISRAAYHLALTSSKELPPSLSAIIPLLEDVSDQPGSL